MTLQITIYIYLVVLLLTPLFGLRKGIVVMITMLLVMMLGEMYYIESKMVMVYGCIAIVGFAVAVMAERLAKHIVTFIEEFL